MAEITKNSRISFRIRDVSIDGSGIGVCEENGMTVFCFGAHRGETVTGTVIKKTGSYIVAKSDSKASSEHCPVYPMCGGCSLLHFPYEKTLEIKAGHVRDCLERIGGLKNANIEPIIPSPMIKAYRNKAIYRFAEGKNGLGCGFFRRNSHDVIVSGGCFCEKPLLRKICGELLEILNGHRFTVYDEETGKGLLRALMIRVSTDEKAMVCVSVNGKDLPDALNIAGGLMKRVPAVVSFYTHSNTSKTNTIFDGAFTLAAGEKTLTDHIGGAVFEIAPESFFQVNPYATVKLYDKAFEYALEGENSPVSLLDIYCGIGTIGIYFAKKAKNVMISNIFGVDYTDAAISEAAKAVNANGISANCRYVAGDAGKVLSGYAGLDGETVSIIRNADVAVVDPPRKGLDDRIPGVIASLPVKKVVYVSCNPATLARDIVKFREELGFELDKVTPVDMFPFEGHVECVTLMTKR